MLEISPVRDIPDLDEFYDKVWNSSSLSSILSLPDGVKVGRSESGEKRIAPQRRLAKTDRELERVLIRQYYVRDKYSDDVSLSFFALHLREEIKIKRKKAKKHVLLTLSVAESATLFLRFLKDYPSKEPERPSICRDPDKDNELDRVFMQHDYIDEEYNWQVEPGQFIAAYWALQQYVFKPGKHIPRARKFGARYNFRVEENKKNGACLVERNFSKDKEVFNEDRAEMERIFKELLPTSV